MTLLHHSLQLVAPGDVVRGHISAKKKGTMTVTVTSLVRSHKFRELSDLDIEVGVLTSIDLLVFSVNTELQPDSIMICELK